MAEILEQKSERAANGLHELVGFSSDSDDPKPILPDLDFTPTDDHIVMFNSIDFKPIGERIHETATCLE